MTQNPKYVQIYALIKNQVLNRTLSAGTKLPSIRHAAQTHQVSTTTVERAYHQLLIEGYIVAKARSGYFVEQLNNIDLPSKKRYAERDTEITTPANEQQNPGNLLLDQYRKIVNGILKDDSRLLRPPLITGEPTLKKAIAYYLASQRGMHAHWKHIVIAPGIQQLIYTMKATHKGGRVGYLTPGFGRAINAFYLMGYQTEGFETINDLIESKTDYVYLSPSNMYPHGDILPVNDRLALIKAAKAQDRIIIEDDYNHVFRYNAHQIPTIHSIAQGDHVLYIGSFSRTSLASQRMSYMVMPPSLYEHLDTSLIAPTSSTLEQLSMATFINSGHYHKQLNKMTAYARKQNECLKQVIEPYLNDSRFKISGLNSNMHLVITCDEPTIKQLLIRRLTVLNWRYQTFESNPNMLVVPYNDLSCDAIKKACQTLFA